MDIFRKFIEDSTEGFLGSLGGKKRIIFSDEEGSEESFFGDEVSIEESNEDRKEFRGEREGIIWEESKEGEKGGMKEFRESI